MKTDLLLLTLLYAVACASFIGAINARGPARVALSYFLAILTLCAAVFHTSQLFTSASVPNHFEDAVVVTPPPPVPSPKPPEPVTPPPPDSQAINSAKNQTAVAQAKIDMKGLLESARRVARNLAGLNLGSVKEISDEEYEAMQNKAVGYLAESRRCKEKIAAYKTPDALHEAEDNLAKGVDALVTAAYNAERFFKSENDTEEKEHLAAFRRGSQAAGASFKKAGAQLGSEDAGD